MLTEDARADIAQAIQRLVTLTADAPEALALVNELHNGFSLLYLSEALDEQIQVLDACAGTWDQEDASLVAMNCVHALIRDGAVPSSTQLQALSKHGWKSEAMTVEPAENIRKFPRKQR
jgi:hypothetical protein